MIRSIEKTFARLPGWRTLRGSRGVRGALGFQETIWTRIVPDREVRKLVAAMDPAPRKVLEVSGQVWREHGFAEYRPTRYPDFDVEAGPLDDTFDLVIAEHVFEHLRWPGRAARNVRQMLRPGGAILIVTPFLYRVHPCPLDCSRWTETGLRYFLAEAGFPLDGIQTGSWGNRAVIRATERWEFRSYNRYVHSLANEPEYPIVVWALAKAG